MRCVIILADRRESLRSGFGSLCENVRIFVGRSFSDGASAAKSERLQPLKYRLPQ